MIEVLYSPPLLLLSLMPRILEGSFNLPPNQANNKRQGARYLQELAPTLDETSVPAAKEKRDPSLVFGGSERHWY